jgi:hypothetical protein
MVNKAAELTGGVITLMLNANIDPQTTAPM